LYAALAPRGFPVALLNPLRTRRFAEVDLERTKTDAIDALGIARFAAHVSRRRPERGKFWGKFRTGTRETVAFVAGSPEPRRRAWTPSSVHLLAFFRDG